MSLVARAKAILLRPTTEWGVLDAEAATVGSLYTGFIIPLAAVPALARFIGFSAIGTGLFRLGTGAALWITAMVLPGRGFGGMPAIIP